MKLKTALERCELGFRHGIEIVSILLTVALGALIFNVSGLALLSTIFALVFSIFTLEEYLGMKNWRNLKALGFDENEDIDLCMRKYQKTKTATNDKNMDKNTTHLP